MFNRRRPVFRRISELREQAGEVVQVEDVATICDCSRTFVYESIRAGILPATRIGREYRIPTGEAIRFAQEQLRILE